MTLEAIETALDDAGLTLADVDGLNVSTALAGAERTEELGYARDLLFFWPGHGRADTEVPSSQRWAASSCWARETPRRSSQP